MFPSLYWCVFTAPFSLAFFFAISTGQIPSFFPITRRIAVPCPMVASPIMAKTAQELCMLPSPLTGVLQTVRGRNKVRLHHHFPNQLESC